jgi:hypothetical protein
VTLARGKTTQERAPRRKAKIRTRNTLAFEVAITTRLFVLCILRPV